MERISEDTYRCTVCDTKVRVGANETPVSVLVGQSGKSNERVVTVGDVEIHRCTAEPSGAASVHRRLSSR